MQIRLDSSRNDDWAARWRRPVAPAQTILRCDRSGATTLRDASGKLLQTWTDPLRALAWLDQQRTANPAGRWIGFLSYELGRFFERLPSLAQDDTNLPLFLFTFHPFAEKASELPASAPTPGKLLGSNFSMEQYLHAVRRAIDYIGAGDIFQVNLAQRFVAEMQCHPAELYAHLHQLYPAQYAALLDYDDFALICNSPELFLRVNGRQALTRPIKGTRPRQPGMAEELLASVKDQAELNMIIDLERNDLGRVCELGSVRVTEPRTIETHPTVYHGAATIAGTLRDDVTLVDLLRATFPGGSITGAPKIRAMEIIEELEPTARGPYCGAIGYLDPDGTMEFNIAIRTIIQRGTTLYVPVGGGIVADSIPEHEYEETLTKAHAAFAAMGIPT